MLTIDYRTEIAGLGGLLERAQDVDTETLAGLQAWVDSLAQWGRETAKPSVAALAEATARIMDDMIRQRLILEVGPEADRQTEETLAGALERAVSEQSGGPVVPCERETAEPLRTNRPLGNGGEPCHEWR